VIPEETGGPYPGDGTNSNASGVVNVLTQSGVVRSDIRSSFNGPTGVAAGVPLTIKLQVINVNGSCASLDGYAIYLWHCDRDGNYSLYSSGVTTQNYLRGVQATDSSGNASFTTIFPGCYSGRVPHVHFEVYRSLAAATSAANRIKTSQFTFPVATCNEVYATTGYSASVRNMAAISLATDNVFSDGYSLQMSTVTGNATDGYVATLTVGVAG
jgi:protocatechuate 3,4-dioxygenase beta subunit